MSTKGEGHYILMTKCEKTHKASKHTKRLKYLQFKFEKMYIALNKIVRFERVNGKAVVRKGTYLLCLCCFTDLAIAGGLVLVLLDGEVEEVNQQDVEAGQTILVLGVHVRLGIRHLTLYVSMIS